MQTLANNQLLDSPIVIYRDTFSSIETTIEMPSNNDSNPIGEIDYRDIERICGEIKRKT